MARDAMARAEAVDAIANLMLNRTENPVAIRDARWKVEVFAYSTGRTFIEACIEATESARAVARLNRLFERGTQ